jgi:hypothetical protein
VAFFSTSFSIRSTANSLRSLATSASSSLTLWLPGAAAGSPLRFATLTQFSSVPFGVAKRSAAASNDSPWANTTFTASARNSGVYVVNFINRSLFGKFIKWNCPKKLGCLMCYGPGDRRQVYLTLLRRAERHRPGLIVSYPITVDTIVDLRGGFGAARDALWQDFYCDWSKLHFNDGIEPLTWIIGDQVLAASGKGTLFASSIRPGGTNLVLYNDELTDTDSVVAHDPNHMLPKNQDSWRK